MCFVVWEPGGGGGGEGEGLQVSRCWFLGLGFGAQGKVLTGEVHREKETLRMHRQRERVRL